MQPQRAKLFLVVTSVLILILVGFNVFFLRIFQHNGIGKVEKAVPAGFAEKLQSSNKNLVQVRNEQQATALKLSKELKDDCLVVKVIDPSQGSPRLDPLSEGLNDYYYEGKLLKVTQKTEKRNNNDCNYTVLELFYEKAIRQNNYTLTLPTGLLDSQFKTPTSPLFYKAFLNQTISLKIRYQDLNDQPDNKKVINWHFLSATLKK